MQSLISIIIPIYKVEQYIQRCVLSVVKQNYRPLEVILVDDDSPDSSMKIAKECIESILFENIHFVYLRHEKNRGLSAARNTGLSVAKGEYVYFLDSDDELSPDCIENLVPPLTNHKYDFIIGDFDVKGEEVVFPQLSVDGELIGNAKISKAYKNNEWFCMAWNKLCKKSFLIERDLFFKERLIHEDELWSALLASTAQSMYAVKKKTYIYHIRGNSITTSESVAEKIPYYIEILQSFYDYQCCHQMEKNWGVYPEKRIRSQVFYFMEQLNRSQYDIFATLRKCDKRKWRLKKIIYGQDNTFFLIIKHFTPTPVAYALSRIGTKIKQMGRGRIFY